MKLNRSLALGVLPVIAGIALVAYGAGGEGNVSSGGFVLIGPFPIVFGTGTGGRDLALLSVLMGSLMVVLLLAVVFRFRALTYEGAEETDK